VIIGISSVISRRLVVLVVVWYSWWYSIGGFMFLISDVWEISNLVYGFIGFKVFFLVFNG